MLELISVHLPKTAGTAFRHVLTDIYGMDGVLGDYPPDSIHDPEGTIGKQVRVIHGHFQPTKYQGYFPAAKRIVWLRHPLFRLISEYFFAKTINDRNNLIHAKLLNEKLSILEFAKIPQMRNFISKKMRGMALTEFDFVGIQEFYQTDLNDLQQIMGWQDFQPIMKNGNRYPQYQKCIQEILNNSDLFDSLAKLNREDLEMYRQALQMRAKRRQESPLIQFTLADWQRSQFLTRQIQNELEASQAENQQYLYWLERNHHNSEFTLTSSPRSLTQLSLIGFHFDSPSTIISSQEKAITLSGWVIGKSAIARKVVVTCGQSTILETEVNQPRPDVAQVHQVANASSSGFSTNLVTVGIPSQTTLDIFVVLDNGQKVQLGAIKN